MLETPFYIYRHIRPDRNEVFYVGQGNNLDAKRMGRYARAKAKASRRNTIWKRVVDKNDGVFIVEIMMEFADEGECNRKEMELIALYGRRDLGLGTLVNLTDGGEGCRGVIMSDAVRARHSRSMIGKNGRKVIDVVTQTIFDSISDAEKVWGITDSLLGLYLNGKNANKSTFMYLDEYHALTWPDRLKAICQPQRPNSRYKKAVQDTATGRVYESLFAACKDIGRGYKRVSSMMTGKYRNTTTLQYL